ncbi:hypothetical protein ACH4OW_26215 [Streptomyces sp. NPDC017056]|uniref:hypothetical protein n=1 Tax=Streptomyces sp. NPDC017056 TaxID=3364973 RepID=UPI0037955746
MGDAETVARLVAELADGWREHIEYDVAVQRHSGVCRALRAAMTPACRRHHECECPSRTEARAEDRLQPSLIRQLQEAVTERTAAGNGSGVSAQEKSHSSPPGNQEALDCLFAIETDAHMHYALLREALYPHDRAEGISAVNALRQIADWCALVADGTLDAGPDLVHEVKSDLHRRVRTARIILGYDSPQRMLASVVCGECGGALSVADDASTDVRCIGTPETAPCGTRYYRWQWIELLEESGSA